MKKLVICLFLAHSIALSPIPAFGGVDENTARSVLKETGMWAALAKLPSELREGVRTGMAGAGGSMSTGAAQRILQAVDTAFTVERIQTTVLGEMRKGLDATTVAGVRRWNATSLGQKLLTLEQASTSSTDQNRRLADGQAALEKANEARRKALADILDATKAVDGRIEIALVTAVAMMRGVNAATPGAGTLPPENQLRSQLQSQMTRVKEQIRAGLTINLAVTYARLSTEELQQYVGFLRSPAGRKLNELAQSAIETALRNGAEEFGRKMAMPSG